jgi:hypothetical protein
MYRYMFSVFLQQVLSWRHENVRWMHAIKMPVCVTIIKCCTLINIQYSFFMIIFYNTRIVNLFQDHALKCIPKSQKISEIGQTPQKFRTWNY